MGNGGLWPAVFFGAALAAAARACGLACRPVPVESGGLGEAQVRQFAKALEQMPPPVLAFCRSGTRSATVRALAAVRRHAVGDILRRAAAAGYDLRPWRAQLEQAAAAAVRETGRLSAILWAARVSPAVPHSRRSAAPRADSATSRLSKETACPCLRCTICWRSPAARWSAFPWP